ncbi:hypothetical protein BDN72DRAFT_872898 [Pluteus cervinus]|uniref:Uncharacterized protein n=1 Tax=Pluteus cervinus TaxID=181527 RepID=A0ACD3A6Q6_9AGAR|nr:hypothetical protein BDN72DRAFT_872898 [Pluteus cervinus]
MDPDRKSTVSTFFGGRKSSMDPLNNPERGAGGAMGGNFGPGRDDASSFFNPDREVRGRNSADLLNPASGFPNSAGYNRGSFFHAGREEPLKGGDEEEPSHSADPSTGGGAWDVYADFNNAGPKYSSAFGSTVLPQQDAGYRQIGASSPLMKPEDIITNNGPVEMVTVPGLGPEWRKEEMRDMTKAGRRERKYDGRMDKFKAWNRGQRGMCGRYCTRKVFVFALFGICGLVGLVLGFTIPRVPGFNINNSRPLANATGSFAKSIPVGFSRSPANFSFPALAELQLDTSSNWLPLTINSLHATVYDLDSARQIGSGQLGKMTFPAKAFPDLAFPLNFSYLASNDSDQTWMNWYDGCRNAAFYTGNIRPAVKFRLLVEMNIAGLPTSYTATTQVSDANCPVELSINAP